MGSRTVYRYRDLQEPPPRQTHTTRASVLDPYVPYLLERWEEGCRDGKRLLREIRERGYRNSQRTFIRFTAELRRAETAGKPPSSTPRGRKGSVAGLSPTAKNVAALFMRREEKLSEEQKEYLGRLCASDAALADARRLTQEFAGMVRGLEGEKLDGWLEEAGTSEAGVVRKYAAGLKKDFSAVRAGLTERWSNGPVEGFVHKLKLAKRQGYGRAGFDLLRARVLAAGAPPRRRSEGGRTAFTNKPTEPTFNSEVCPEHLNIWWLTKFLGSIIALMACHHAIMPP